MDIINRVKFVIVPLLVSIIIFCASIAAYSYYSYSIESKAANNGNKDIEEALEDRTDDRDIEETKSISNSLEEISINLMSEIPANAFDSVEVMRGTAVNIGDIVYTKGYRYANDGGAAKYKIVSSSKYGNDGYRGIALSNGLTAELIIENNTVIAEQFGASGDGISDDAPFLQNIIDCGYNVQLTAGKTYKCISNGLYITNPIMIIGNGAKLLVDDTYTPQREESQYYFIRNEYGKKIAYFGIANLSIEVAFSDNRISGREFVVLSPLGINQVGFDNIEVSTNESNNCINCIWMNGGCDAFSLTNSKIYNRTSGKTGGALWLRAKPTANIAGLNELKNCTIQNSYIYCSSADEALAIWGTESTNASIINTTVEGDIKAQGRTRPISVFTSGDNNAVFNVDFQNCTIKANCSQASKQSYYDSVLGIGTDSETNAVNVKFSACSIEGNVYGALLFPSTYRSDGVTDYSFDTKVVNITFDACNINCNKTITGSSPSYYDTAAEYPSAAWDCTFNNCNISCGTAFAYLYMTDNYKYYVPQIEINNSIVTVKNAKSFIMQPKAEAGINLIVDNSTINAKGVKDLITVQTEINRSVITQDNAVSETTLSESKLNKSKL